MSIRKLSLLVAFGLLLVSLAPLRAQDDASCPEGERFFAHELLATDPVCIPDEPLRILTLEPYSFEALYTLGVPQAGTMTLAKEFFTQNFPEYTDDVDGIAEVGFPPNLELILALEPDLILGTNLPFLADLYDELSAIAPTLLAEVTLSGQWQDAQRFFAAVVGQPDAMQAQFDAYDDRLAAFADALEADPASLAVSVVRVRGDGIAISGADLFPTTVLQDAGLSRPAGQLEQDGLAISLEELQAADGDVIFIWMQEGIPATMDDARAILEELVNDPLWAALNAVQNDQVYIVGSHWIGYGFVAAHAMLDDLFVTLTDADPADVAPNPFNAVPDEGNANKPLAQTCPEGERFFAHELLATDPVCIPDEPLRILTLGMPSFETLMALGIQPYASPAPYIQNYANYYPGLADEVAGIRDMGPLAFTSIEAVVEADPDLIIGHEARFMEFYDDLSAVAPTLLYEFEHSGVWQDIAAFVAQIVNREAEYDALLADYNARVEDLQASLGDTAPVIPIIRVRPDALRLYVRASFPGAVVEDVGLPRPESQDYDNATMQDEFGQSTFYAISRESIQLVAGDVIFIWTSSPTAQLAEEAEDRQQALLDDPLFGTLDAVQARRTHEVGGYWIGSSFVAAHYILDDLFTYVAEAEPTIPNPFRATRDAESEPDGE
ncbi:MAG: ABC transporter substrate-binding protein [Anaerolineales bacterium]